MCLTIDRDLTREKKKKCQKYFYFWKVALEYKNKYYSPHQRTLIYTNKENVAERKFFIDIGDEITAGAFHAYVSREDARFNVRTYFNPDCDYRIFKIRVKKGNVKYFGDSHDVCFTRFTIVQTRRRHEKI